MKQPFFSSSVHLSAVYILLLTLMLGSYSTAVQALTFNLPTNGDNVVGRQFWMQALPGDNFSTIARRYDMGYYELVEANPGLEPGNLQAGTIVVIPMRFILPSSPHTGLIINLAELRMYYYPPDGRHVITYPIGIGREGWDTPLGPTHIIEKTVNPTWHVPESIRKDRELDGVFLPKSVPPGPANPLGGYRMRLSYPTYLIHGTNDYTGVGRRSSSGCIRMYPEDVEALFPQMQTSTPINIINTAFKAGWSKDKLYLESHVPVSGNNVNYDEMKMVVTDTAKLRNSTVYWSKARHIAKNQTGIPQVIGKANSDSTDIADPGIKLNDNT